MLLGIGQLLLFLWLVLARLSHRLFRSGQLFLEFRILSHQHRDATLGVFQASQLAECVVALFCNLRNLRIRVGQFRILLIAFLRDLDDSGAGISQFGLLRITFFQLPDIGGDVRVLGSGEQPNQSLEKAGRVADFFELADLMCIDALQREESCGAHFRVEHQTPDGEALRHDDAFAYVAAWEFAGDNKAPILHKEPLAFENVALATRSYR